MKSNIFKVYIFLNFKELVHMMAEGTNPKSKGQASRLDAQSFYVAGSAQNFFSRKPQLLLRGPSADEMRPTHKMEGNLYLTKSTLITSTGYPPSNI